MSAGSVSPTATPTPAAGRFVPKRPDMLRILLATTFIVIAAEVIGPITVPIGPGGVTLLPLVWALIAGALYGACGQVFSRTMTLSVQAQVTAAKLLQPVLLLFITRLGLLVGGSIPKVLQAGWALVFQEFGHFLGTMVFGLPLALLLGIKREAIGATFSIGREPSLAIIGERFGMNSPEGRGVLAEYLTGAIFGAIFIALFAGLLTDTGWFSPYALAMGSGIGSGSMMAAASGAIAARMPPSVADDIAVFAAASNLITTTIGTYFTVLISLPCTIWAYRVLEPLLGRRVTYRTSEIRDVDVVHDDGRQLSFRWVLVCWLFIGCLALVGNRIGHGAAVTTSTMLGMVIIVAISVAGLGLYRLAGCRIPAVLWCSIVAMLVTLPGFPGAATVRAMTAPINFLSLVTPILALAGLSVAKDIPAFRRLGWRIVVVSFCANAGTFLGATLIAQFFMHQPN
ncbi:DUF3100 domain-containing protein [Acetobacter sacchari]|uniref:DUF3100 domain-containing protein n=1 Tax=Acetobacter sacchari TaxID=2661687 RepID=A0ABS3LRT8_9PROT|nr:DUF3100 domain-containing protein [Acetobacter sacchari]MBO1358637.1 DUF3100 domain-containing protein [Acetobacter sacchari]